jgi:hypothetical protein
MAVAALEAATALLAVMVNVACRPPGRRTVMANIGS